MGFSGFTSVFKFYFTDKDEKTLKIFLLDYMKQSTFLIRRRKDAFYFIIDQEILYTQPGNTTECGH